MNELKIIINETLAQKNIHLFKLIYLDYDVDSLFQIRFLSLETFHLNCKSILVEQHMFNWIRIINI